MQYADAKFRSSVALADSAVTTCPAASLLSSVSSSPAASSAPAASTAAPTERSPTFSGDRCLIALEICCCSISASAAYRWPRNLRWPAHPGTARSSSAHRSASSELKVPRWAYASDARMWHRSMGKCASCTGDRYVPGIAKVLPFPTFTTTGDPGGDAGAASIPLSGPRVTRASAFVRYSTAVRSGPSALALASRRVDASGRTTTTLVFCAVPTLTKVLARLVLSRSSRLAWCCTQHSPILNHSLGL
mmetsp:Transcript_8104/g.20734  ORF Transcript_8104/g.20734 Transcript_8104/m.20734 type:complete len:247 (-) Transcript_8104:1117-1857(-)